MILIDDIVFAEHLKFSMVAQTTVNIIHVADNINGIMVVKNIMNPVFFFKAPGINNIIFGYEMGMFDITDLYHRQILLLGFDFLLYMIQRADNAVSKKELAEQIWHFQGPNPEADMPEDFIKRLRKKLLSFGSTALIETVWGFGYRMSERKPEGIESI